MLSTNTESVIIFKLANNTMKPQLKTLEFSKFKLILLLLVLLVANQTVSQNDVNYSDSLIRDLQIFKSDEPLNWSLTFDIKEFRREKHENKKLPAVLTLHHEDRVDKIDIRIVARGESRKTICYFPPIKLKLKNVFQYDPYLSQVNNQKLVTHCNESKEYAPSIHREYLIYKIYNLITEKSFKVQLINMNYIDSRDKVKPSTHCSFLIEDIDVLAKRNNSFVVNNKSLRMCHVNKSSMIQLSLFHYMIGNVDWSISDQHNVKLIRVNEVKEDLPYAIPYDFDFSGFVNASYAINVRNHDISSVKKRMFVGVCYTKEEYHEITQSISAKKDEVITLVNDYDLLETKTRKRISSYLNDSFELITKPDFYDEHVVPNCKKYDN